MVATSRATARYALSIAPVEVPDVEIDAYLLDYVDKPHLETLRLEFGATHVFRRFNGTKIVAVPVVLNAPSVEGTPTRFRLHDNLALTAALIRNALLNLLHSLNRPVFKYHPIEFLATGLRHNLLQEATGFGEITPEWLAVRPLYTADIRPFSFDQSGAFVGMACDVRTRRIIDASCDVLLRMSYPLDGLYVSRRVESADPRIQRRLQLVGRVESVADGVLHLSDCRPGMETVAPTDVIPDPHVSAFRRCLTKAFPKSAREVSAKLDKLIADITSGPKRFEQINAAVNYLAKTPIQIIPDIAITLRPLLDDKASLFPRVETVPRPTFVFDAAGMKTAESGLDGINRFGPYSKQTFDKNSPRICVVCQSKHRGKVDEFVHKLLNGVPRSPGQANAFVNGLIGKYHLRSIRTIAYEAQAGDAASYEQACRAAIDDATTENMRWDLALIQTERRYFDLFGQANPYLSSKRIFLDHQVPVQSFTIETVDLDNSRLSFALNNMALASYAKMDGVPWLIKSSPSITHELVFGLGSTYVGTGRLGERRRVVGITTVFSSDGNYWLSNVTRAVGIDEYAQTLLEALRRTVGQLQKDMNWRPRDAVRLIFHVFKPLKDAEAKAVKGLLSELGDYDVGFAFVHVDGLHPYLLFDLQQDGISNFARTAKKGKFAPTRGIALTLSTHEGLIVLTGPSELKRSAEGMAKPILLRLHRESTFLDVTYLTRQLYHFASHSWRSFAPASEPVTVYYSSLVARLLGKLGTLPTWDPDVMLGRIGRTRWFL